MSTKEIEKTLENVMNGMDKLDAGYMQLISE